MASQAGEVSSTSTAFAMCPSAVEERTASPPVTFAGTSMQRWRLIRFGIYGEPQVSAVRSLPP